jgi:hypothetical protein
MKYVFITYFFGVIDYITLSVKLIKLTIVLLLVILEIDLFWDGGSIEILFFFCLFACHNIYVFNIFVLYTILDWLCCLLFTFSFALVYLCLFYLCFLQKAYLKLTGLTRAVVMLRPVTFEVELSVKGAIESEDKDLSYLAEPLVHRSPLNSSVLITDYTSKLSTMVFTHGHICRSVEVTISVKWFMGHGKVTAVNFLFVLATSVRKSYYLILETRKCLLPLTARSSFHSKLFLLKARESCRFLLGHGRVMT